MPFIVPALVGHLPVKEGGENKANKTINKKKKQKKKQKNITHLFISSPFPGEFLLH